MNFTNLVPMMLSAPTAVWCLLRARLALMSLPANFLLASLQIRNLPDGAAEKTQEDTIKAISRTIGLAAGLVPWRSDCMVQAIAARHMLQRKQLASQFYIGVSKADGFVAHAWLASGGIIVTGGDISKFVPLIEPI